MASLISNAKPLVTVVTVVFNGGEFLEETILSVLNQTYDNIQYIIIDGASTDNTVEIIKKYEHKIGFWVSEKDEGIYDAMNKGISLAKGDLIGILNADDFYLPNCIKLIVDKYLISRADLLFGNKFSLNQKLQVKKMISVNIPSSAKSLNLHSVHPTIFVKKLVYDKVRFDISYKISADYEFLLKVFDQGYSISKIDQVLTVMRLGGISATFNLEVFRIKYKRFGFSTAYAYLATKIIKYCWLKVFEILYRDPDKLKKYLLSSGWSHNSD